MQEHEVLNILDKRTIGKNEEYLLKLKKSRRPIWESKKNMNCNEMLLDFEKSRGPEVLGAVRESENVTFLIKFGGQEPKVVESAEAKQFSANIIHFLESKIEWIIPAEGDSESVLPSVLVEPRNSAGKFIYATKSNEGIIYFFKYKNGEIATMKSVDATVSHSESLVDYLGKCIA